MKDKREKTRLLEVAKEFIAKFIRDKNFLSRFSSEVVMFDFDSILPGLNWVIEVATDFYSKYQAGPPLDYFLSVLRDSNFSEDRKVILERLLNELFSIDLEKVVYRVDEFRDEMARILLKTFWSELGEMISGGKVKEAIKGINALFSKVSALYKGDVDIEDFGRSWKEREKRREALLKQSRVLKLGIKDFDEQVRMAYRTVTAFLAPFKRYKSITLTNVGWAALLQRMNVLHVNYEGRREMVEARYDSRFSDLDFEKIMYMRRTDEEQRRFESIMNMVDSWKQRLFIVWGVPYVTSVKDIKGVIDMVENLYNIYVDVVIIDYFQIMGTSAGVAISDEEDWRYQHRVAWDLVDLANYGEKGRIVVGALQTKMYAVTAETLRADHSGRSVAYPQVIDNLIAINQTPDEREEGIIRLSPLILRDGEIKKAHCKVESMLWRMKIAKEMDSLWEEVIK